MAFPVETTLNITLREGYHFANKKDQALDKFNISSLSENNRNKWYNWLPDMPKQKKKRPVRLMNKARWSKPYFNKKI